MHLPGGVIAPHKQWENAAAAQAFHLLLQADTTQRGLASLGRANGIYSAHWNAIGLLVVSRNLEGSGSSAFTVTVESNAAKWGAGAFKWEEESERETYFRE